MVQGVVIEEGHIIDTNPANGEVLSHVKCTTPDEVDDMVAVARAAQPAWALKSLDDRVALLKAGVAELATKMEDLAKTITAEMGKIISESTEEACGATDKNDWLDLVKTANLPEVLGKEGAKQSILVRDPLGVVVVLSPWNFPADEILLLSLPALTAGNTVIVKPSEVAPLVGQMVVSALQVALPKGVIQIAQGDGGVGSMLVGHKGVNMVALTGSSAVGRKVMASCAPDLKRLVLELGGKDPMVVFADADLDRAAADAVNYSLFNAGQVCCSVERIYVDSSIRDKFEAKVTTIAAEYKVGDGMDETSRVGPMVSSMQAALVEKQVKDAIAAGAKVLFKSPIPEGTKGNYYPVTVLTDLKQEMMIQSAETFGPVVAIAPFDGTEEEAVRLANDSEYGLASYVYTTDMARAHRVASRIKSGQVGINCYSLFHADPKCPWVGHKGSGFGYHSGADGWRQFSVPKSIVFDVPTPTAFNLNS